MAGKRSLVLGGARSGKSRLAERMGDGFDEKVYLATGQAHDEEMRVRIDAHRARRGAGWRTREAPSGLAEALVEEDADGRFLLVDCLTLWLSNLMLESADRDAATDRLLDVLRGVRARTVLVSNEVGLGLVPETPLGRRFRDAQGELNRRVAEVCDEVLFVAAGLPMTLKGELRP